MLATMSPEKGLRMEDVLAAKSKIEATIQGLQEQQQVTLSANRNQDATQVIIHGVVHPGVSILMYESRFDVSKDLNRCRFRYDPQKTCIVNVPL